MVPSSGAASRPALPWHHAMRLSALMQVVLPTLVLLSRCCGLSYVHVHMQVMDTYGLYLQHHLEPPTKPPQQQQQQQQSSRLEEA